MGLLSTIGAASGRAFGLTRVGAAIRDAYFNLTTLLLPGNGTNGAQNNTFLDSSNNTFSITRNGDVTQGSFSPFSQTGWSNSFASGAVLNLNGGTPLTFGTGDFTIEFWVYYNGGLTADVALYDSRDNVSGNGVYPLLYSNSTGKMVYYVSSAARITSTTSLVVGTWYHVALARSGTSTKLFINGIQEGSTYSDSNDYILGTNRPSIGAAGISLGADPLNGYMSNVRVVKGRAVYTSAFTPPTEPLGATSGGQNPPTGTQTSLLTCQSNRFADNGGLATPNTINIGGGTPSVQAFSPFAPTAAYSAATVGGSGYFDGSVDSLSSTTNFEASTSTSTFTIEGFIYPTTFSTLINIIGGMVVSSGDAKSIAAEVNTSGQVALYWFDGAIKRCTGNTVMQLNAWNYFAIVVNSNAIAIYVNKTTADTLSGTTTLTNRTQLTTLGVGAYYNNNAPAQYFNGYLSNIRVSTVARTISAVPTAPLTSDANVRWLFNFTNAGITDATAKNVLETEGGAQISTTQSKFGGSSMYFDGTGDYLIIPDSQNFNFTGDFTIEFWMYANSVTGSIGLLGKRTVEQNFSPFLLEFGGSSLRLYLSISGSSWAVNGLSTSALSTSTWYHIAVTRNGSTVYFFVNGAISFTGTASGALMTNTSAVTLGRSSVTSTVSDFNGYIDDFRITKGYARYTANFTAPTAAFALQ